MALTFASVQPDIVPLLPDLPRDTLRALFDVFLANSKPLFPLEDYIDLTTYSGEWAKQSCKEYIERNGLPFERAADGSILLTPKEIRALLKTKGNAQVKQFMEKMFVFVPAIHKRLADSYNAAQQRRAKVRAIIASALNKRLSDDDSLDSAVNQLITAHKNEKERSELLQKALAARRQQIATQKALREEREALNLSVAKAIAEKEEVAKQLAVATQRRDKYEKRYKDSAKERDEYMQKLSVIRAKHENDLKDMKKIERLWDAYGCQGGAPLESVARLYKLLESVKSKVEEMRCVQRQIEDIQERQRGGEDDPKAREAAFQAYGALLAQKQSLVANADNLHIVSDNYVINFLQGRIKAIRGDTEELRNKVTSGLVSLGQQWGGPPKMTPKMRGELNEMVRYALRSRIGQAKHAFETCVPNEVYIFKTETDWVARMMKVYREASNKTAVKAADLPDDAFPSNAPEKQVKFDSMMTMEEDVAHFMRQLFSRQ